MLEIDEDEHSIRKRRNMGKTMDCFRKTWLTNPPKTPRSINGSGQNGLDEGHDGGNGNGQDKNRLTARWRRCARCAAVMEDTMSQRQSLQWLMMQQRRCFCSGYWDNLPPGKIVA